MRSAHNGCARQADPASARAARRYVADVDDIVRMLRELRQGIIDGTL
jgi:hypothetical protein